nr:PaaI family thioesterase [Streptomyces chartreusis]
MYNTPDVMSLSGLELLQWVQRQPSADVPSIGRLLGISLENVEQGRVVFSLRTRPEFANPLGYVHGGITASLLDSAMACAVHSTLPPATAYTTLELKVNYIRSVGLDGCTLTAEGSVVHAGRSTATAEGKVLDEDGRLIAHATTTCLIIGPDADR